MIDQIETARLILRQFQHDDLPAVYELLGNDKVMEFSLSGPYDIGKCEQFINHCKDSYSKNGFGLLAVVVESVDRIIGYCGISLQEVDGSQIPEIGYRFHPDFWGQGYATEAARGILNAARESGRFAELIAIIEPENISSIRLAEKLGFCFESKSLFHKRIPVNIYRKKLL